MSDRPVLSSVEAEDLAGLVAARVSSGERFGGLFASARSDGTTVLRALLARHGARELFEARLSPKTNSYPALTPLLPAASWYEREIHDLFGIEPVGHPRLDALVLALGPDETWRPRPGAGQAARDVHPEIDDSALLSHVAGQGLFTIPYGPVRSGIFESVEYLVETFGEDIPHVQCRVQYKHRGIEGRFGELGLDDGLLLAERVEGTAAVAHALAYCQALESLSTLEVPRSALLARVLHAELERVACHLDSIARHCEGAGQSVAYARMTVHKERVQRLRAQLCGHRFGRGVVVPGGVCGPPRVAPAEVLRAIDDATAEALSPPEVRDDQPKKSSKAKGPRSGTAAASKAANDGGDGEQGSKRRRRSTTPPPAVNEPLAFITFVATYPLGSVVDGEVISFTSHGAMVDVGLPDGSGMHCYVPLSGLGVPAPTKAREVIARGERRPFVLIGLDPPRRVAELALPGIGDEVDAVG